MDISLILRIVKAFIVSLLLYFSLIFLGFPKAGSLVFSLVPFVFGSLNIMVGFAYSLAGIVFFIAALTALFPDIPELWDKAEAFIEDAIPANSDEPAKTNENVNKNPADSKADK